MARNDPDGSTGTRIFRSVGCRNEGWLLTRERYPRQDRSQNENSIGAQFIFKQEINHSKISLSNFDEDFAEKGCRSATLIQRSPLPTLTDGWFDRLMFRKNTHELQTLESTNRQTSSTCERFFFVDTAENGLFKVARFIHPFTISMNSLKDINTWA